MTKLNRTKQAFYVDNFVVSLEEVPSNLMRKERKKNINIKVYIDYVGLLATTSKVIKLGTLFTQSWNKWCRLKY